MNVLLLSAGYIFICNTQHRASVLTDNFAHDQSSWMNKNQPGSDINTQMYTGSCDEII